jgi:transposase-like protein
MKDLSAMEAASFAHVAPAICRACRSSSILTTAKKPDADSYWRCTRCGEVWNASRARADRPSAYRS